MLLIERNTKNAMAHHKRRRAPNRRAFCKLCKPHKISHAKAGGEKDKRAQATKLSKKEISIWTR